ncbi:hypothetical protein CS0771_66960 [Catellatospora sp. IY07-71]|uniref:PEP/pyruvate-binding domain-containing protein n=1 Tax=Catellatospora sp. IY07-71 TaxID=2728827 RepID=UPI001BB346E0|nr:PEP/pyruvate-binding domain-containing protein [Catellatospora sp. IY07-71]BCJ77152.1 hypothetical protein CS0771_66960 [Catellatospora sp. IY07-71]
MTTTGRVVPLAEAGPDCGGKAAALAVLLRAGLPVPDGFVVTGPSADEAAVTAALARLGPGPYAVRSSGLGEDGAAASFAGQLETVLGVRGSDEVLAAIRRCAASGDAPRARAYRARLGLGDRMTVPVLVQELVAADRAGVLFTRDPRDGGDRIVINAAWGLGESVVSGAVVPDEITVWREGGARVAFGDKRTRLDPGPDGPIRSDVPEPDRFHACLDLGEILPLAALGWRCEELFGRPQDVEWAVRDGRFWLLQSRPITTPPVSATGSAPDAGLPAAPERPDLESLLVVGVASSPGQARGPARLVRSVDEFSRVRPGDVLVCRTTDPAWTPLFRLAAAVVTETGGLLSHAAIVAREFRIPAVVGAAGALSRLIDGAYVVVDGALGTVTLTTSPS